MNASMTSNGQIPILILASTSPRRRDILSLLGVEFSVVPADIDESILPAESPYDYVHRLAKGKADRVAQFHPSADIIIGGDVTIDIAGRALAKAEDAQEARMMLNMLSDKTHYVRDAYAIYYQNRLFASGVQTSEITFRHLTEEDIEAYIATNEWQGKAGAYAIQGKAREFIQNIVGSYYDVLGLPILQVYSALLSLGVEMTITAEELFAKDRALKNS